jgi:hypothetical protein
MSTTEQKFSAHKVSGKGRGVLGIKNAGHTFRYAWENAVTVAFDFSMAEATALLNPVDCAYTLVFTRGEGVYLEQTTISVSVEYSDIRKPNCGISMSKDHALGYFAHYDTVEIQNLRAVIPEPTEPHCRMHGSCLFLHTGSRKKVWDKGTRNYLGGLSTKDLSAICNPHKCNVRIKAVGPNEHKITYFTAGKAMTPGDLLEYDYLDLIGAEPEEN